MQVQKQPSLARNLIPSFVILSSQLHTRNLEEQMNVHNFTRSKNNQKCLLRSRYPKGWLSVRSSPLHPSPRPGRSRSNPLRDSGLLLLRAGCGFECSAYGLGNGFEAYHEQLGLGVRQRLRQAGEGGRHFSAPGRSGSRGSWVRGGSPCRGRGQSG